MIPRSCPIFLPLDPTHGCVDRAFQKKKRFWRAKETLMVPAMNCLIAAFVLAAKVRGMAQQLPFAALVLHGGC